jgi:tetrapyrrole methylase family protein/MazG family protein
MSAHAGFKRLYEIVARLRGPDGCPWDREQTPETMRANLIEEAYETVEAINERDPAHTKEELGDLFLLATMISYMYEEAGAFTVESAFDAICEKLVRRHPHVFGNSDASTSDEVLAQWQDIKVKIEGRAPKDSILDDVSRALPPLERAYKLQKKAAKAGFDWARAEDVWAKVGEEIEETREALASAPLERVEEELGDLLFSMVNVSRFIGVDPAVALHRASEKFYKRFRKVESGMRAKGLAMGPESMSMMDALWEEAKREE